MSRSRVRAPGSVLAALSIVIATAHPQTPGAPVSGGTTTRLDPIIIGVEYVLIDRAPRVGQLARMLAPTAIRGSKHYAEHAEWGEMQPSRTSPIDFHRLDGFVREMEAQGATELTHCPR